MTTTQTAFDLRALTRAIEERDATAQLAHYDDDAEVRLVDRDNTPGSPRVLRGKAAIREWLEDLSARDMTHRVEQQVVQGDSATFVEACRYPDGTNVLCSAVLELRDGRIARQLVMQVWDDAS